jgi:hypothetical protein
MEILYQSARQVGSNYANSSVTPSLTRIIVGNSSDSVMGHWAFVRSIEESVGLQEFG